MQIVVKNSYFHSRIIIVGKARSLPLDLSPTRGSTQVGLPANIRLVVNNSYCHPRIIFVGKARSLPLDLGPLRGSPLR